MSKAQRGSIALQRGRRSPFHACWYPVALSNEIGPGQVRGVSYLGGRVVVYRTERGVAQVRSAYCRHLGADLSVGEVVGETIRCPFHHWRYDTTGKCVEVPAGDPPPAAARLFIFPTAESLGIIWAFNGVEPSYAVPGFGEGTVVLDTFRNPVTMKVESDTVVLNSFAEDAPIFDSIRFERGCLTQSDKFLTVGMEYVDSFPEARPAAGLFD